MHSPCRPVALFGLFLLFAVLTGCGGESAQVKAKGQWDVGVSTQRSR